MPPSCSMPLTKAAGGAAYVKTQEKKQRLPSLADGTRGGSFAVRRTCKDTKQPQVVPYLLGMEANFHFVVDVMHDAMSALLASSAPHTRALLDSGLLDACLGKSATLSSARSAQQSRHEDSAQRTDRPPRSTSTCHEIVRWVCWYPIGLRQVSSTPCSCSFNC